MTKALTHIDYRLQPDLRENSWDQLDSLTVPTRTSHLAVVLWPYAKPVPTNLTYSDSLPILRTEPKDLLIYVSSMRYWQNYTIVLYQYYK